MTWESQGAMNREAGRPGGPEMLYSVGGGGGGALWVLQSLCLLGEENGSLQKGKFLPFPYLCAWLLETVLSQAEALHSGEI